MAAQTQLLTQDRLKEILTYDPESGLFTWNSDRSTRVKAGDVAGTNRPGQYVRIRFNGTLYFAQRLAWLYMTGEWPPSGEAEHRNRIRHDNRWSNLRDATHQQNTCNIGLKSNNTSGYVGVYWIEYRQQFLARITIKGKKIALGY